MLAIKIATPRGRQATDVKFKRQEEGVQAGYAQFYISATICSTDPSGSWDFNCASESFEDTSASIVKDKTELQLSSSITVLGRRKRDLVFEFLALQTFPFDATEKSILCEKCFINTNYAVIKICLSEKANLQQYQRPLLKKIITLEIEGDSR
ncbi:hypothetical protein TNCV_4720701 [Trichonephila clavipes]|uniref:Uncharacterized protein n=1 Tax=Trichonephila clavipes TaxID=2585209 RepID=A0A8X6W606_TRICX|nr:hypothetical protein TNCV_4720701 [Trichonephila clavipes]